MMRPVRNPMMGQVFPEPCDISETVVYESKIRASTVVELAPVSERSLTQRVVWMRS